MKKIKTKITTFLLWAQKYTKMDMLYLAKGGFWIGLSQTINTVTSLALMVAFANLLPKEMFGIYRYILSLAAILNIFLLGGIQTAVTRSVARGDEGALRHAVTHQLRWNIMMSIAFFMVGTFYLIKDNTLFGISFFVLGTFVPATFAFNTYGAFLTGKKEFRFANISSILSTLFYAAGALCALLVSGDVAWLIVAYATTGFVSAVFFYVYTVRTFKPAHTDLDPDMIAYGKKLSFISLIGPIAAQIDKIILVQFWGPAQLATYSLAMAVPGKIVPYLKKFVSIGSPKFATRTKEELNVVFYQRIFQGMTVGFLLTGVYIISAPIFFKYLLPQYMDGVLYSQILAISFIFAMPTRYIGHLLESQKMSRQIFINSMTNSILAIVLYVVLGMWGGILGLVIAYVLWSSIGMLVNLVSWRMSCVPK